MAKYVKFRHRFYFALVRPVGRILARKYHFKTKPVKLKKGEHYLILANHQGVFDPIFLAYSFKNPVYIMATDSLFSTKWWSRLLSHCLAPIKKRKGVVDIGCIRTATQIAKEGGNIALFPEGNRAWADFQFYIDKSVCKLVRLLKMPLILYNFTGGYGVNPRWSKEIRKGQYRGKIVKKLSWEQISAMTDDELHQEILSTLKVIDSDSGKLFKSKRRAEYLERELFICPKCGSFSTLHSHGNTISCSHCGLQAEYGENLHLTSPDPEFHFEKVVDWYKFQLEEIKKFHFEPNQTIFEDENVEIFDKTTAQRIKLSQGKMLLTSEVVSVGEISIPLSQIVNANPIGGKKMIINAVDKSYFIEGDDRFNGIKYVLFFNILCEKIANSGGDKYYGLSIDNGSI